MEKDFFKAELNWWDKLTGPFCRLWWKLCDQWKDFGYRRQRFQRGYASCDVWEMRTWFIKTVKPMLQDLSIHRTGCPAELTDEGWGMILDEMVGLLELMDIWDDTAVKEKYAIPGEDTSYETQEKISLLQKEATEQFFSLFSKWFWDLWD